MYFDNIQRHQFVYIFNAAMSSSMWRGLNEVVITPLTLTGVAEFIASYLCRSDVPALVKEYMFHLLAQVLRILYRSQTTSMYGCMYIYVCVYVHAYVHACVRACVCTCVRAYKINLMMVKTRLESNLPRKS